MAGASAHRDIRRSQGDQLTNSRRFTHTRECEVAFAVDFESPSLHRESTLNATGRVAMGARVAKDNYSKSQDEGSSREPDSIRRLRAHATAEFARSAGARR